MKKNRLIVELVGLPGAGKTSFVKTLNKLGKKKLIATTPYFRKIEYLPFFAINTLLMLPTFLRIQLASDSKWLTPRDIALMVIVNGWYRLLERQNSNDEALIFIDEGPICYLTRLYAFGSESLKAQSANRWWNQMYKLWAKTLDIVIWFDVPDPILIERIRSRDAWQEIKEMSDVDAYKWLATIRSAQEYVLAAIAAEGKDLKFLSFNTEQKSPNQIYDEIIDLFDHTYIG